MFCLPWIGCGPKRQSEWRDVYDVRKSRTRIRLSLDKHHLPHRRLRLKLSLVPAPGKRIGHATLRIILPGGTTVVAVWPEEASRGPTTRTDWRNRRQTSTTSKSALQGGLGAVNLQAGVEREVTHEVERRYTVRNGQTARGDGVGSSEAYWVFVEDISEAGRGGIATHTEMYVELDKLPDSFDFKLNLEILPGRKKHRWNNAEVYKSGVRTVSLRDIK
ncbi:hypothetical protein GLOTRDRAFT_131794 [Gloeophyllum trabeum ATCC 11539]|uniref:Uncharacterized protein n=1 Tax=Gloeophyllum trabeum (strain ATCC 11539 / FP-39264 / Madison 617) TaxID=670483 RepID=S7RIY2_GLOTA|nr:uncharacterized protein GLOTRDRAFT_131794 [Gloeophyllum trabeum ATCC 11539]EPQ52559.1 hypothetical protein GLOTRDRAFT_131794 [Gloeophyllum trabeum ATCC 11539]